jgi:putative transposase
MGQDGVDHRTASDEEWREAERRERIIRPLAQRLRLTAGELADATRALGLKRTRIYDLVALYRERPLTSTLIPPKPGPQRGRRLLPTEVEAVIEKGIGEYYMTRQKPTVTGLWRYVKHECRAKGLTAPSAKALGTRVAQQDRKAVVLAREGAKAAQDQFAPVIGEYGADYALQVVQIDHTRVDVIVVDEVMRRPLGRPWLTLLVDIASRTVAGFYLTLEAPSATSVGMAVRHAVLPKGIWLAERGIDALWPVSGIPDVLHMDNAREFHSKALKRGCAEYGIDPQYRPVATPHFGGHIERLIGTMMGSVHLLPGTTFSSIQEKGDADPEKTAVMTLTELETWLAIEIVGVYHARIHSAIKVPPVTAWEEAVAARPVAMRHPVDPQQFLYDFLPCEHRKVRRDGIRLFSIHYWDGILTRWAADSGAPMPVKYDPRDLSRIFLMAPDGTHWPIRYRDLRRPRITLWEQCEALRDLRERGQRAVDEALIFKAVEAQRLLVAEAAARTRVARKAVQKTAYALAATNGQPDMPAVPPMLPASGDASAPEPAAPLAGASGSSQPTVAVLPYDVEEWS